MINNIVYRNITSVRWTPPYHISDLFCFHLLLLYHSSNLLHLPKFNSRNVGNICLLTRPLTTAPYLRCRTGDPFCCFQLDHIHLVQFPLNKLLRSTRSTRARNGGNIAVKVPHLRYPSPSYAQEQGKTSTRTVSWIINLSLIVRCFAVFLLLFVMV